MRDWSVTKKKISHKKNNYFSIIGIKVKTLFLTIFEYPKIKTFNYIVSLKFMRPKSNLASISIFCL